MAKNIEDYLNRVGASYESNPEQKSAMLLTAMDLWMAMDSNAIKAFDILKDFNTGFPANILDVLQLARGIDMHRLQRIRKYIQMREEACKYPKLTMFGNVQKDCFAERYYDSSTENGALLELRERIEEDAERSRQEKEQELQTKSLQYEELARELMVATVCFLTRSRLSSPLPHICDYRCDEHTHFHACADLPVVHPHRQRFT
jgi:hypothetical protein